MRQRLFLVLSVVMLGVAACSPQGAVELPTVTAAPVEPTAAPAAEATVSEEPAPPAVTPTARAGLEATDPTGVSLGAGSPALVEFFAFW